MSAPVTPSELRELLPKRTDSVCDVFRKVGQFDSALQQIVEWMFDACGDLNLEEMGVDVNELYKLCVTTTTTTTTTTTSTTTTTTTTTTSTTTTTVPPL